MIRAPQTWLAISSHDAYLGICLSVSHLDLAGPDLTGHVSYLPHA